MKKIILILIATTISIVAVSQKNKVYFENGIGYDITNNTYVASLFGWGYNYNNIVMDGCFDLPIVHNSNSGNYNSYISLKVGYSIYNLIVPQMGYYWNVKSTDDKDKNSQGLGYSIKIILPITIIKENGSGPYIIGKYVMGQVQVTAGIHAVID